jgi:hypothetical protein
MAASLERTLCTTEHHHSLDFLFVSDFTNMLLVGGWASRTNRIASAKWIKGELHGRKPRTLEELNRQIEGTFVAVSGNALENALRSEPSTL